MKQLTSKMLVDYNLALQAAKNKDYDNSFDTTCNRFGPITMCIRLHDKISRLKRLSNGEANVKNESMFDTWLDTVNYALMSYAWLTADDTTECFRATLRSRFENLQLMLFNDNALTAANDCELLNLRISDLIYADNANEHDADVVEVSEALLSIADIAFRQCLQYNDSMLDERYVNTAT